MADVNWTQYHCKVCLMIGLALAAVVSGLVGWLVLGPGIWAFFGVIVFLIAWAVLGLLVDGYCRGAVQGGAAANDGSAGGTAQAERHAEEGRMALQAAEAEKAAFRAAEVKHAAPEEAGSNESDARTVAKEQAVMPAGTAAPADVAAGDPVRSAGDFDDAVDRDHDGVVEGREEGIRPTTLDGPRGGQADDLKRIKGIGPKLEQVCNELGFYHLDQIAAWTPDEVAWVDSNLEGFRGRVTRDDWVAQAKVLSEGGETDFSKRVDDGDVPSSQ